MSLPWIEPGTQNVLSAFNAAHLLAMMDFMKKTVKLIAKAVILALLHQNVLVALKPLWKTIFRLWMHNGALDALFVPLVTNLLLTEIFSNMRGRHIAKRISMLSRGRCVLGVQNPFQVRSCP